MHEIIYGFSLTCLYLSSGTLLWCRWIRALPPSDPLRLAAEGERFSTSMSWAFRTVCALFVLLWPLWASVRFAYQLKLRLFPQPQTREVPTLDLTANKTAGE